MGGVYPESTFCYCTLQPNWELSKKIGPKSLTLYYTGNQSCNLFTLCSVPPRGHIPDESRWWRDQPLEQHRLPGKTQPAYIVHQNKWVRVHHPWYYMQQILPKKIIWGGFCRFYENLVFGWFLWKPGKNKEPFLFFTLYKTW